MSRGHATLVRMADMTHDRGSWDPTEGQASDAPVALVEAQRQLARDRMYRAAWAVLAERGLSATVEDVADKAGVSVRTMFRHFGTRDRMVAEALRAQLHSFRDNLPRPVAGELVAGWLARLLDHVHEHHAALGRAYWDLAAPGTSLPGEVVEVASARRVGRTKLVQWATTTAWELAGGRGQPPGWLMDAFAIHLNAFATQTVAADASKRPRQIAASSALALHACVEAAASGAPL